MRTNTASKKVADACIVKIRQHECGNYTKDERRDKTSRNANHREVAEMEETKIFVEMSKSQYEEIKKALLDIADITQEHNRMILLTQSALTEDAGTVRIASPSAAKSLLDYVKNIMGWELRGEWVKPSVEDYTQCSICGHVPYDSGYKFCPECGADVRG